VELERSQRLGELITRAVREDEARHPPDGSPSDDDGQ
jgi:hypothetical protein